MYLYMYSIKIIISIHIIISSNSISKYVNSRIISNHVINSRVFISIHIIQHWRRSHAYASIHDLILHEWAELPVLCDSFSGRSLRRFVVLALRGLAVCIASPL